MQGLVRSLRCWGIVQTLGMMIANGPCRSAKVETGSQDGTGLNCKPFGPVSHWHQTMFQAAAWKPGHFAQGMVHLSTYGLGEFLRAVAGSKALPSAESLGACSTDTVEASAE